MPSADSFVFLCSKCKKEIRSRLSLRGESLKCLNCGAQQTIPWTGIAAPKVAIQGDPTAGPADGAPQLKCCPTCESLVARNAHACPKCGHFFGSAVERVAEIVLVYWTVVFWLAVIMGGAAIAILCWIAFARRAGMMQ